MTSVGPSSPETEYRARYMGTSECVIIILILHWRALGGYMNWSISAKPQLTLFLVGMMLLFAVVFFGIGPRFNPSFRDAQIRAAANDQDLAALQQQLDDEALAAGTPISASDRLALNSARAASIANEFAGASYSVAFWTEGATAGLAFFAAALAVALTIEARARQGSRRHTTTSQPIAGNTPSSTQHVNP